MYLFGSLRRWAFWLFDAIKGRPVAQHYKEVKAQLESPDQAVLERNLTALLEHAAATVPFYKAYSPDIKQFPVLDKNVIKSQFDGFYSSQFAKEQLIKVITSGSTGTPFQVFHDKNKKNRNYADTLYFSELSGYSMGNILVYMKIWAKQRMAQPWVYRLQNTLPIDVLQLSEEKLAQLTNLVENKPGQYSILGYVSALEEWCRYLDRIGKGKINANVRSIITISEALNSYTSSTMERIFGVPVYSRYSNLENGIIAQQVPGSGRVFLVNTASYYLEILEMEGNNPVQPGEKGRIVVTDLFNYAFPMIRYDTGDIGSLEQNEAGHWYLTSVEGRKLDQLFDTSGKLVSSYIMYRNMWQYTNIRQYQIIQEAKGRYCMKISVAGTFEQEAQLQSEFLEYLGADADFRIEYVDEIPLLNSGKRRKVVNLMLQNPQ